MARIDQRLRLGSTLPPGKANVVADALSRKSQYNCMMMDSRINTLCDELNKMSIEVIPSGTLSHISIEPTLSD
jgi:hypothetical protein